MNRRDFVGLAAAAPFALRTTLAAASAPAALVTCDTESRLAVVDLGSFRVLRHISTPLGPRSVELAGARAIVCHWATGQVSIVDGHRVLHVVAGLSEPRYTAAHPDGVHAFVTDSAQGLVSVDVVHGRIIGRVSLPGWPRHVSLDPGGRTVWVGLGTSSPHVAVVDVSDPKHPRHVATVTPPFGAHDVGFTPDGRSVWVTAGGAHETALFGPHGNLVARSGADAAPQHVTFAHGVAYVTSGDSGTLRVHGDRGELLRTTAIPGGSYNVQADAGRVITPSLLHGTLTVLDRRGLLLDRVHVASSCHDACFLPR